MEKKNVPEIRFEGFTDDWEKCKIGDIGEIVSGGTPDTNNPNYWDGDINWYAPAEIVDQIYVSKSERKITELGLQKSSAKMLPANRTILFTSRAGIGKTAILQHSACTNQGFQSLVLKNGIDPYFIYSMGNQLKEKAEAVASGSTFLEISGKMLANLNLMMPNRDEQERIAAHFKNLDKLIILYQRKYKKLKLFKEAMLDKMFPKNGQKVPEIRFKGFTDDWEQHRLGEEVTDMIAGGDIDKNLILEKGRYPVIANALTNEGIVGYYDFTYRIKAPAVTVTGRGDVGHAKARSMDFTPVVRLLTIKSKHDIFFMENSINILRIVVESTGVPQLTVPQLAKYELYFPKTLNEEKVIGKYFHNLDNLITLHQRKYEKLKLFKEAMLNKMFI
ncbi:MAG: restriction endonuclease subunit S [Lachnospiraceae bacterium]|nr:restriction endonuclease subunit S [Lachnospiraceae bacterium]